MSIVPLNIGSASNDGNGQNLRSGGQVINANFAELDQRTTAAQSAADAAQAKADTAQEKADAAIPSLQKGQPNGVAGLDGSGTVPASQLPSYVDDVLEFGSFAALPAAGETGKIYITIDNNNQYRWTGTVYVQLTSSPGTTDAVPEGTVNKYWTNARTLASVLTGLVTTNSSAVAATDSVLTGFGKLQRQVSDAVTSLGNKAASGVNNDITQLNALTTTAYNVLRDGLPAMVGATLSVAGTKGLAPAPPVLGENPKFLSDRGTYLEPAGAGGGMAVGTVFPWKYSRATIPGGSLPHDGQIVTNGRTLYPDLWALIQPFCVTDAVWLAAPYTSRGLPSLGNGTTDFRMPDDNAKHPDGLTIAAMVLRGDGKNSAGTPGAHQADQFQGFRTASPLVPRNTTADAFGLVTNAVAGGTALGQYLSGETAAASYQRNSPPFTDGVNGTPRVGTETRSANSTVIWCTVAAKTTTNQGTVDVPALATAVSTQGSQIQALDAIKAKRWTSANLTLTATPTSFTHALGVEPDLLHIRLTLTAVTGGWPVGTVFRIPINNTSYGGSSQAQYGVQATNITNSSLSLVMLVSGIVIGTTAGAALVPTSFTAQLELLSWR